MDRLEELSVVARAMTELVETHRGSGGFSEV
jgi:hypothetical protein